MWRPLQDAQTPRPLQLAIGRADHPWPRPDGQAMGTPRVPMAAEPGSAGPPRRIPCGTSCRPRGRSRSREHHKRASRGVRSRRIPARLAQRLLATLASSRGSQIGGHAANVHGSLRATENTDVLWIRSPEREAHVLQAL
jgi:hypothetical protein